MVGQPLLVTEIKWMAIGERLGSGHLMYRELWDHTAPLAVFVYKYLYLAFGKSRVPYFIVSILLITYQAGVFNTLLLNNKAYKQNTYVPALMYVICMNLFVDFLTLSPVLMSLTFVLLALNNLFKRMDNATKDELFVFTGVYLGLAVLFYLPAILCLFVTLLSLIIYTGSILRRMLLLLYGFGVVILLASVIFLWLDGARHYHEFFFGSVWNMHQVTYTGYLDLVVAALIPFAIFILSLVKVIQGGKFINYQVKIQYVMSFYMLAGIGMLLLSREIATFQLIFFVPFLAFFISHYLLIIRNWLMLEVTAFLIVLTLFLNHVMTREGWLFYANLVNYEKLYAQKNWLDNAHTGKSLFYIGRDLNHYRDQPLATPFLDWQLSEEVLRGQSYYDNNVLVYKAIKQELPQVIVDDMGVLAEIFSRLPTIADRYRPDPRFENVYLLKN